MSGGRKLIGLPYQDETILYYIAKMRRHHACENESGGGGSICNSPIHPVHIWLVNLFSTPHPDWPWLVVCVGVNFHLCIGL